MSKTRRNHAPTFKAKVALEAPKGEKTIHEIAAQFRVHPNQLTQWRKHLADAAADVLGGKRAKDNAQDRDTLLAKIGQLTGERFFLQRVLGR